jgi:hypothetical protein
VGRIVVGTARPRWGDLILEPGAPQRIAEALVLAGCFIDPVDGVVLVEEKLLDRSGAEIRERVDVGRGTARSLPRR